MVKTAKRSHNPPGFVYRLANVVGFIILIAVNVLAGTGAFGPNNAELSARWDTPLTPPGWAFAIWGLIFSLQACGVVYQALPYGYEKDSLKTSAMHAIGPLWLLGWLFEVTWQLFFVKETQVGMCVCAVALLGGVTSFAASMVRLRAVLERYKEQQARSSTGSSSSSSTHWLAVMAFLQVSSSVNAAWLSVASCLGLLIVPIAFNVSFQVVQYGAIGLASVVVVAGCSWLLYAGDAAFGAGLLWPTVALSMRYKDDTWIFRVQLFIMGVLTALILLSLVPRASRVHKVVVTGGQQPEAAKPLLDARGEPSGTAVAQ